MVLASDEHIIATLGLALQLSWVRFLLVRKEAKGSRPVGLWFAAHGFSVLRLQHYPASCSRSGAHGCPLLRQTLIMQSKSRHHRAIHFEQAQAYPYTASSRLTTGSKG